MPPRTAALPVLAALLLVAGCDGARPDGGGPQVGEGLRADVAFGDVIVHPGNPAGWAPSVFGGAPPGPSAAFEVGPAAPPLGLGSVELGVGPYGGHLAQVRS